MGDVTDPLRRLAGTDLCFLAQAAHARPPGGNEHVLDDAGTVGRRAVADAGLDAQQVDLHGLRAVVAHVEQSHLDAGRGEPGAGTVRDQLRERYAERAREGIQRAQRRIAGAVLYLRERPLADVCRLRERADGESALPSFRTQPLAHQTSQIVHNGRL
jgi:hypothetical protein